MPYSLDRKPLSTARSMFLSGTALDTTYLGFWDFDSGPASCTAQSWTSHDATAQKGDYFHVDDFAGLGSGTYGLLQPLEGTKSMWCGVRADTLNPITCGYLTLAGYGNGWNQAFCSKDCIDVGTQVTVTFLVSWDSEPNYDFTHLEVDNCDGNWIDAAPLLEWRYADSLYTWVIEDSLHESGTKDLRFRFHFTSDGAWSDQDGIWNTDGAVIIDSLLAVDGVGGNHVLIALETFEDEAVGALDADDWESCTPEPYGDYAGLFSGYETLQEDPCRTNLSCFWGFFENSAVVYDCVVPQHPEQPVVPYKNVRGQFIDNDVWSPRIPWTGSGEYVYLEYDVYRDLPLVNNQFYMWRVRSWIDGCPGVWKDNSFLNSGDSKAWHRDRVQIGHLIDPAATEIQVSLGVVDMCSFYYCFGITCHSHSPLFDNVSVYRVANVGPTWNVRDVFLFQDTFAEDGTLTGTARADIGLDINRIQHPSIVPGDSVVVTITDQLNGIAGDPMSGFGPAAYMYVSVWPQGQAGKSGSALTQDPFRFPVVDSVSHGSSTWYAVRADSAFAVSGTRVGWSPYRFCFDLNDNLFTPGDTVYFVLGARNTVGDWSYFTDNIGTTNTMGDAFESPMEFTILPTSAHDGILYVDNYDGLGAQPFFDWAFEQMVDVDRYDKRAPTSRADNGLASRVKNVPAQLLSQYRTIVWNPGDLRYGTIGDGVSVNNEKQDDVLLLATFLDGLTDVISPYLGNGGVYFSGDNIATELASLTGPSVSALTDFISYNLVNPDHRDYGLGVNPYGVGTDGTGVDEGTCFYVAADPDSLIVYGGCPTINDFDVLSPVPGASLVEMTYEGLGASAGAIISQTTTNSQSANVGVMLSGFSYHEVRDAGPSPLDRFHHLEQILNWLGNWVTAVPVVSPTTLTNRLGQNYPNPFNPVTTIAYQLKEPGRVTLNIYNVAGQLVRTLVDANREAGINYEARWDGTTRSGERVASGVYFYRLVAKDFVKTRKMVLLK